jgi:hypothetical protein
MSLTNELLEIEHVRGHGCQTELDQAREAGYRIHGRSRRCGVVSRVSCAAPYAFYLAADGGNIVV